MPCIILLPIHIYVPKTYKARDCVGLICFCLSSDRMCKGLIDMNIFCKALHHINGVTHIVQRDKPVKWIICSLNAEILSLTRHFFLKRQFWASDKMSLQKESAVTTLS